MKFKIKKEKLEHMLEMLMLKDILPTAVLTLKDGKIFSIQQEEHARALRILKLNKSFFEEEVSGEDESVEIDSAKLLSIIKGISDRLLTVDISGNKISVIGEGDRIDIRLPVKEPEQIKTSLPFKIENGIPLIGEDKKPLDVHINILLEDFKEFCNSSNPLKTDFFKFLIEGGVVKARVGDIHDFDSRIKYKPRGQLLSGTELDVAFSYGIPQIGATFVGNSVKVSDGDEGKEKTLQMIGIRGRSGYPMWFYENTSDYSLGVVVPPYVEEE